MKPDLRDMIVFSGFGLVVAGVALIYVPAAMIVAGASLLRLGKVI